MEIAAPTEDASVSRLHDTFVADEPTATEPAFEPPGWADLRAAVILVASGDARSVTLSGFPDGHELVRLGRSLASEDVVLDLLIRNGGGGFDIRVHQASPSKA